MALHPSITTALELSVQHEDDSTLWQDTAGTTAAETTDPVRRWDDQSNSYNLLGTADAQRPIHTADGIDFDGSNDRLRSTVGAILDADEDYTIYLVLNALVYSQYTTILSCNEGSSGEGTFDFYMDGNRS